MFHVPEKWRVLDGPFRTDKASGNNGMFMIPQMGSIRPVPLRCVASDGTDWLLAKLPLPKWEHVSVSAPRMPTWDEMCLVKRLFWDAEDVVVQFHPRASQYVNYHERTLHLWAPIGVSMPEPPSLAVGPR